MDVESRENHSAKKFRSESGTGVRTGSEEHSDSFSHKLATTPVVHVRGLPENVTESDLHQAVMNFGTISYIMQIPNKNMALIEFENVESATSLINYCQTNTIFVGTKPAIFNYSNSARIKRPDNARNSFQSSGSSFSPAENSVILLTILNARHPITVDVIHAISHQFGSVLRIVIFKKNGVQAMVEFDSIETAKKAKEGLHGQDIYSECCSIRADFAKPQTLNVRKNDHETWDFTIGPNGEKIDPSQVPKNQPLLADPRFAGAAGGPFPFGPGFCGFPGFPGFNPAAMMGYNMGGPGFGFGGFNPMMAAAAAGCMPGGGGGYPGGYGNFSGSGYYPGDGNYQQQQQPQQPQQQMITYPPGGGPPSSPTSSNHGGSYQKSRSGRESRDSYENSQAVAGGYPSASALLNAYESQSMASTTGTNPDCVIMVYGMDPIKFNCQRLFNLLCIYGSVIRVKFLKNKEGSAMVQMGDRESCERVTRNLNGAGCFGSKLVIGASKQSFLQDVANPHTLPDGTSAFADFVGNKNQRYNCPDPVAKNRPVQPTSTLYFYNAPPNMTEETLTQTITDAGAVPPTRMRIFPPRSEKSSAGLLQWSRIESCTDALILANHVEIYANGAMNRAPFTLKLAFSQSSID